MFRNLYMLRKNLQMSRIVYSRYTFKANLATSSKLFSKPTATVNNDVTVTDINIYDMAKGDAEFTRNFLTTLPSLEKHMFSATSAESSAPEQAEPTAETETGTGAEADVEPEPSITSGGGGGMGGVGSSVLDRDGMPIVPIEIDGWKQYDDDEDGPTVQNSTQHVEIGNDAEYKKANMLEVPDTREGHFEYKGIKVKLPEKSNQDVGTYRFRRDKEDLESVADDMRVVKYDKK